MKNRFSKYLISTVCIFLLFASCFAASADSFDSYTYNSDTEVVEAPAAVNVAFSFTGAKAGTADFKSPQDLTVDNSQNIYIADTGNNRIVVTDAKGRLLKVIDCFESGVETDYFKEPKGIFVTESGEMYICDTGNNRIVHLDADGVFIRQITLVSGESLPEDFIFKPVKLAVDGTGRIFAVSEGFNNGLLEFTTEGKFIRYMGASSVTLTASQAFWRALSTKEQRAKTSSNVSNDYNNVEIDEQGFLLVTSTAFTYWEFESGKAQPLRKLNAKGSDVLSRVGNPSGDLTYPDTKTARATYKGPSSLVDVCTMPYGNYGVLDQNRGRVFVYNSDGELIYEFGGPANISGGMTTPTALDYCNDMFYTLDAGKNQVNVYSLTKYGKLFGEVAKASEELNYDEEEKLWNSIINENVNCELAMRGLGTAAYRKQDMSTAMKYFKEANDTEGYSKAYVFVRRQWIENNAIWLIVAAIAFSAFAIVINGQWKKLAVKKGKNSYVSKLRFAGYVAFHPISGYWELKREKQGSVAAALTFMLLACAVKIISSVGTGFLFNSTADLNDYNFWGDVFFVVAAVLLWTVTQWCVTVLMSGEGSFKDIFIATGYSLTPYIWLNIIAVALSRVLSLDEAELYTVFVVLSLIYTAFLLFMSIMSTHDYTLGKTFLTTVIILVVILLILFVAMLLITLTQQMVSFGSDLYNEILLRI